MRHSNFYIPFPSDRKTPLRRVVVTYGEMIECEDGIEIPFGWSICSPKDHFSRAEGRARSSTRLATGPMCLRGDGDLLASNRLRDDRAAHMIYINHSTKHGSDPYPYYSFESFMQWKRTDLQEILHSKRLNCTDRASRPSHIWYNIKDRSPFDYKLKLEDVIFEKFNLDPNPKPSEHELAIEIMAENAVTDAVSKGVPFPKGESTVIVRLYSDKRDLLAVAEVELDLNPKTFTNSVTFYDE